MRRIDADALMADIKECIEVKYANSEYEQLEGLEIALSCVDEQPTVDIKRELREAYAAGYTDAVQVMRERARAEEVLKLDACTSQPEIIRCKDCLMHGVCRFEQGLGLDGYCSQAERREE